MKNHQKFLAQHCYIKPPVDLSCLLRELAITLVFFPFRKIDGMCLIENGVWTIVVRQDASPTRQRFTIAHELKHILDGESGLFLPHTQKNSTEIDANTFAGQLLVPTLAFVSAWQQCPKTRQLARTFWVSRRVIQIRKRELGLS